MWQFRVKYQTSMRQRQNNTVDGAVTTYGACIVIARHFHDLEVPQFGGHHFPDY